MSQPAKKFYTLEEYFALEETAEYKSEYFQGEIFAMAGGSANHSSIALNVGGALDDALLEQPCRVFNSDIKIQVKKNGFYTYPDVAIVCGEVKFASKRDDTITNPLIVVEVLSPSTESYDRGKKFELYKGLESFQDYLLIDQNRVYIEYHHKLGPNKWLTQTYEDLDEIIKFEGIELELPVKRVYRKIGFEKPEDNNE